MAWVSCPCGNPWCTRCECHAYECACETAQDSTEKKVNSPPSAAVECAERTHDDSQS